ncbi:MAG: ROK family protein [Candidatus Lokiarchaeota archaeon]|nr:ROK family protein [Candidatus Lokiarchaeota archaeon]
MKKIGDKYIAGVDIGGTWIRVAICTIDMKEENFRKKTVKTLKENKFSISTSICEILSEVLKENHIEKDELLAIGIASAGPLNTDSGIVFNNANLGFRVIPLREPIENKFSEVPIYFINDGSGAVLGVYHFEANESEKDNLVYITMSTGIGGGVICNGHLLIGKEGNAAEIGHAMVDTKSRVKCNCGAYGCWEAYSSGTGVESRALEGLNEAKLNADKLLKIVENDISKITAKEVFQAARNGDILSNKIVDDCIFYTKVGIGLINNFYDCSSIYLGGAMMNDKDLIIPELNKQFEKDPLTYTINRPPKIKITKYQDEIGLRGALTYAKYKIEQNKIII